MPPENQYTAPGIYVEEIVFKPAVVALPTSVPAFIAQSSHESDNISAKKVTSMAEFTATFGDGGELELPLRLYFENGGTECIIVDVRSSATALESYMTGLALLKEMEEVTLVSIPGAVKLDRVDYSTLMRALLQHCSESPNRFALIDVQNATGYDTDIIQQHRSDVGDNNLAFGASYFPFLIVDTSDGSAYVPPSAAIAGLICRIDRERGVWKAPANEAVNGITGLAAKITNDQQQELNVDAAMGKSINAIRFFEGKGHLVWGARTLAGNDNNWRYVPVRRTCSWIHACVQKALELFSFESNDEATWTRVSSMIGDFLYGLWKQGALQGTKPEQGYFIKVGLGRTMTAQDIAEGRLIAEIGVAMLRPAEFIIFSVSQQLVTNA